ncbi:MAG: GNAT family N-acetyltransferase [Rhodospirillales bacterium]
MVLHTDRLRLRPLAIGDAAELHALIGDPDVMAFWDVPEISDAEIAGEILAAQLFDVASGAAHYWAIERSADGAFIGSCDISDISQQHRRAEIGFILARQYWGAGYALEAMRAVVRHAALQLGLQRLSARTHAGNTRSVALLTRLGFHHEGLLRGYVERAGARHDCQIFGLLL